MNELSKNSEAPTPHLKTDTELTSSVGYTCIGGRTEDQDCLAYYEVNGHQIFTVCDGMGGHAGGCVASALAAKTMTESLSHQSDTISISEAIVAAVSDANSVVYRKSQEEPSLRGMGTTITLLVINNEAAYVTHIGDSRVYQLRSGRKVFRTFDHSMVFEQVARGNLTEEEARQNPRSNILSRALGVLPDIEVKVNKLEYRKGDRFVLCCDGVWNTQPEQDVISMFTASEDLETTVMSTRSTMEEIGKNAGGHHDNHTMIAVDLKHNSKYRKSVWSKILTRLTKLFNCEKHQRS